MSNSINRISIFFCCLFFFQTTLSAATKSNTEQIPPSLQKTINQLKQKRYQFKQDGNRYKSQTPTQSFNSDYDNTGVSLHFNQETVRLVLTSLGRVDHQIKIQPAQPTLKQQKLVRQVADGIVEWYENSAQGLEHGIDIQNRPQGQGQLTALFSLNGAKAGQNGDEITLQSNNRTLHYGKLTVLDSKAQRIPAVMQVAANNQIALVIDDRLAQYPLSIDPLLSDGSFKVSADDAAAFDEFGLSVSVSGNIALIGAHKDDDIESNTGSAYVFTEDSDGNWTQRQKITASDASANDNFGISVSVSGNIALIGANQNDDNGISSGSAYIFKKDKNGNWTQRQKLTADDAESGDEFGISVSLLGNTALIGASQNDDNGANSGSAYIFIKDSHGDWIQHQKLTAADGLANDWFGYSVSLSGNTALIGAYRDDDNGLSSGSAYIFSKDNNGNWGQQQKLTANDAAAYDHFGYSVSIFSDTALIGAFQDDDNGNNSGSAYVFAKDDNGNWTQQQKLTADDGSASDFFGISVNLSGDAALIGAYFDDDNGPETGSAYVFVKDSNGSWVQQQKLTADDNNSDDWFGYAVSLSGNNALVGAHGALFESGSAYFYTMDLVDPMDADLDGNGLVSKHDLKIVLSAIKNINRGVVDYIPEADANGDGVVNDTDKAFVKDFIGAISTVGCTVTDNPDLDGNGLVAKNDLKIVNNAKRKIKLGRTGFDPLADTNCDGYVNDTDIDFIKAAMGRISTANCVAADSRDLNGDGVINKYDVKIVTLAINKIARGQTSFDPAADTNCDGYVNITDIDYVTGNVN